MNQAIRGATLRDLTTNSIAITVLIVFCIFLLIILIYSLVIFDKKPDIGTIWLALFKDGFLLLGGALTTLIGYYFGSKGGEQALVNAAHIKEEAEQIEQEISQQAPTYDENASDITPLN